MIERELFGLEGRVAVVTGATGEIGSTLSRALARSGARVVLLARRPEPLRALSEELARDGLEALPLEADVLDLGRLERCRNEVLERWGRVDVLVNAAGGNVAGATLADGDSFFELPHDAWREVVALNLDGTLLPIQAFGPALVEARGSVVNISSMAARRALTRVPGYSAAKAAVDSLTRWLAVDLARKHDGAVRVNAIAPGFLLGAQNRRLLVGEDGAPTARARTIVEHTPSGRLGRAEDIVAAVLWLCGPGASFVNGVVVPVDGGFDAFSGV